MKRHELVVWMFTTIKEKQMRKLHGKSDGGRERMCKFPCNRGIQGLDLELELQDLAGSDIEISELHGSYRLLSLIYVGIQRRHLN